MHFSIFLMVVFVVLLDSCLERRLRRVSEPAVRCRWLTVQLVLHLVFLVVLPIGILVQGHTWPYWPAAVFLFLVWTWLFFLPVWRDWLKARRSRTDRPTD